MNVSTRNSAASHSSGSASKPARIVVTDFLDEDLSLEREILDGLAHVEAVGARSEADLIGRVEQADALMVYHEISLTAATIERLERCKLIVRCGVGIDNVDGRAARGRGIDFVNVPDYGTEEVADSAIGLTLTLTRGIHFLNSRLRESRGPWSYTQAAPLHRLRGRTFGIVGCGRIGTAAALRAKALGMHVVFFDPYAPDGLEKALGVSRVDSLAELLSRSFVLSLHCPLTPETRGLIDAAALAQLPAGSFLVNTARGGIVDAGAVLAAVACERLAGAGLDVLSEEPPRDDDPLLQAWRDPAHPAHDRIILNPHSAFYSEEGLRDMRRKGSEACRHMLAGRRLKNVVN